MLTFIFIAIVGEYWELTFKNYQTVLQSLFQRFCPASCNFEHICYASNAKIPVGIAYATWSAVGLVFDSLYRSNDFQRNFKKFKTISV